MTLTSKTDIDRAAPAPAAPARVVVATYTHKHGVDVRAFANTAAAETWRQKIAAEYFRLEFGADEDAYMPDDPAEAADDYFDRMNERGDESFGYEEIEVEGAAPEPAAPLPRLDPRQRDTILAALRYWRREGPGSSGHERDIAEEHGDALSANEIDALCERINFGDAP